MEDRDTPFWDTGLDIEKRIDYLLEQLSIREKAGLLSSYSNEIERLGIPAMSVGGEAAHGVEGRNDQNGLGDPDYSTSFPQPIGMSASWDTELIRQAGSVVGKEARVIYHRHPRGGLSRWAPTIDLERDPRWGRNEEAYGEDPVLTGEMASAYIQGMQGNHPRYLQIAATLKHFYSNNTEYGRTWKNSSIDPRNKYELYLEPFRRAIEQGGAEGVMTSYNRINGVQGLFNKDVQNILKGQYGLGHAVCDGGAMSLVADVSHEYGLDAETLARSLKAGVDAMSDMPPRVEEAALEALELGLITEDDLDRALRNMYRLKLKLGLYDKDNLNPYDQVSEEDCCSSENSSVCARLSEEAVVLLKNDGILPLDKTQLSKETVLIGPLTDEWYRDWYGGCPKYETTILDAINKKCEEQNIPTVSWFDGRSRIRLRAGDKYLYIDENKRAVLSDKSTTFILDDWGNNSYTLKDEETKRYLTTKISDDPNAFAPGISGEIYGSSDEIFSWFALETFHIRRAEDDCHFYLQTRFANDCCADESGRLISVVSEEYYSKYQPICFELEEVTSGFEQALLLAGKAETVILALGHNPMVNAKEETDRDTIAFIPYQQKLFDEIIKVNPNVVVVLLSDYPFAIGDIKNKARAVLWSATGSQELGTAIVNTLVGDNHPAGRLVQTWYKGDYDLPCINDYDIIGGNRTYRYFEGDVLFPFGYGLTYSDFVYEKLAVHVENNTTLMISVTIRNIGACASDEVVQIYGQAPKSRVKKPLKQLLCFERIKEVKPGEEVIIDFEVSADEFRFYDTTRETLIVEEGEYTIWAGRNSLDCQTSAKVFIPGAATGVRDLYHKIKADHYDEQLCTQLVEGLYGYSAVTNMSDYQITPGSIAEKAYKEGWFEVTYRDCCLKEGASIIRIHGYAKKDVSIRIMIDDKMVGSWSGNTSEYEVNPMKCRDLVSGAVEDIKLLHKSWRPIWADIRIPLEKNAVPSDRFKLTIRVEGELKYDWIQCVR